MTFHYPVRGLGPLHLEWAAACYERMQARQDVPAPTWEHPYVLAAYSVERDALRRLQAEMLGGPKPLTYKQRMVL